MPRGEREKPEVVLDQGAIDRGLVRAVALQLPEHGRYAGAVDIGVRASPRAAIGYLETMHRFKYGSVDLAAFAQGWAGMTRFGERWDRDFGAIAGMRGSW